MPTYQVAVIPPGYHGCWGCPNSYAHHQDCPALLPSPQRYLKPIVGSERYRTLSPSQVPTLEGSEE